MDDIKNYLDDIKNYLDDIVNHLERGYEKISLIAVSGDNVERMAMAKQELRFAFQELEKLKEVEADGQDS